MRTVWASLVCWLIAGATLASTNAPLPAGFLLRPGTTPGGEIFDQPTVLDFHIQLTRQNLGALRREPREYTETTVVVNGQTYTNVGVKLKGAAGSFRSVDDQPAMTLHFSKWVKGRRVFGLRRLHLNNSVQDPSYLNEYVGGTLFRDAGVPTPRSAWAKVRLADRDLGLYVLKEAFEEEFLRTFFGNADGNLYDGGFVRDIDQELELESGFGPKDRADLRALAEAAREEDEAKRWARLGELVDVDKFATYAALSVMLVDWDGYPLNRNNYRIYFRPDDGRAVFLPHGMDQLFQRSYMELDTGWTGLVAWGLLETTAGRQLYEERCRQVYTNIFRWERMTNLIASAVEVLRPVQPDMDQRADELVYRIQSRLRVLRRDPLLKPAVAVTTPSPAASQPADGIRPEGWWSQPGGEANLEGPVESDGLRVLKILAYGHTTASWRSKVRLAPGRYSFEGRARAMGVRAVRDERGEGAGLRISGRPGSRDNQLSGNSSWVTLSQTFHVTAEAPEVTLVCELRADTGEVHFDLDSLRVRPLPP
ncbi:MAG: CotH kinase family protein [Verrucomicrobia bacterium]|nr:CotH kinase family protein [Verrucomicrobiota bacterium]